MVSVVIPAYNAAGFIRRTIDSVLAQTYKDFEIIVVDDGSTDNTGEIVKSYGAKVKYVYQQNARDAAARNTGIKEAQGQWIAFLDHDDEWLPEYLHSHVDLIGKHTQLRWCGSNRYRFDGKRRTAAGNIKRIKESLGGINYFENFFEADAMGVCPITTSALLIHSEVFQQTGVFDPSYLRWADRDMWWKIAYRYPQIGYLPEPLVISHLHAQDKVSTKLSLNAKRGDEVRRLVSRHLKLAAEHGCLAKFEPVAKRTLKKSLITTIYHGFKSDARITVKQFSNLFPRYWRLGIYVLTLFPKITSVAAQSLTYLAHKLKLERQVSRRWNYPEKPQSG